MRQAGVELAVGDSVVIENQVLTVMDITGDEITFRLDRIEESHGPDDDPRAQRPPR